ncbi:hypothetical protein BD626DRAFT_412349, partial [Schizophyllum amplum]
SSTDGDIIVFRSVDHVLFNINRLNLRVVTDGPFAEDFAVSPGEVVELTEHSETLEFLFQFVYPVHPVLENIPIETLCDIAEAAEKYRMAPAMSVCYIRMKLEYKTSPLRVMAYAHRHGYLELLDLTAPLSVGIPVSQVLAAPVSPSLFISWASYNDAWAQVLRKSHVESRMRYGHGRDDIDCMIWKDIVYTLEGRLGDDRGLAWLTDLDALFADLEEKGGKCAWTPANAPVASPKCCQAQLQHWRNDLKKNIEAIQSLSTTGDAQ